MAGSPRYIHLLAEAATVAQTHLELFDPSNDELWDQIDDIWNDIEGGRQDADTLLTLSAVGMALLCRLTGTPIPKLAAEATELHIGKNRGYAGADNPDPWANFRGATAFRSTAFDGAMIRCGDKHIRTVNLRANPDNDQVGESIIETLRDLVAYPLIARCLLEEEQVAA